MSSICISVISLNDQRVIASIFGQIRDPIGAHQALRRQVFRQVARSTKLQHMLLDVISKHPEAQRMVLQELAKHPQLKCKFVVVAHEQKKSQVTSRKKTRNS